MTSAYAPHTVPRFFRLLTVCHYWQRQSSLGVNYAVRVNGTDLVDRLCERAAAAGRSVYLLGGMPGAAHATAEILHRRYAWLIVAGTDCPERGFERQPASLEPVLERLREANPDIVFVGLGLPKQEFFMHELLGGCDLGVALGIGGSFELMSGQLKRAPLWMQRSGLEWLFRLVQEPRRLAQRYLVGNTKFVVLVLRDVVRRRKSR